MNALDRIPISAGSVPLRSAKPEILVITCGAFDFHYSVADYLRLFKIEPFQYDILALPGGAFHMSGSCTNIAAREYLLTEARFYVGAHKLENVMWFGHVPCGKYEAGGFRSDADARQVVHSDIHMAASALRCRCGSHLAQEGYIAHPENGHMLFSRINLDPFTIRNHISG